MLKRTLFALLALQPVTGESALASSRTIPSELAADGHERDLQLSCGAARDLLARRGYDAISVRNCFALDYVFTADRDGVARRIFVDPQNGRIWEG